MRTDIEQSISEVAMNPSSFAAALESGQTSGVLVGFEFEFCMPESAVKHIYDTELSPLTTRSYNDEQAISAYIQDNSFFNWELTRYNIKKFSKVFAIRDGVSQYSTVLEGMHAYIDKIIARCRRIFNTIPEDKRARFSKMALKDLQSYKSGTFDISPSNILGVFKKIGYKFDVLFYLWHFKRILHAYDSAADKADKIEAAILDCINNQKIFKFIFGDSLETLQRNFNGYFEYDVADAIRYFNTSSASRGYYFPTFNRWARQSTESTVQKFKEVLEYLSSKHLGTVPVWFSEYHQRTKNATDWYAEPDGSIQPGPNGFGRELVSPPLTPKAALEALNNFYNMARDGKFYTNNSTGLHINVSIPQKIDPLKLAVFTGDQYVATQFGRQNAKYASSVIKSLKSVINKPINRHVSEFKDWGSVLDSVRTIAKNIMRAHSVSISGENKNYISFRAPGGDYLSKYQEVYNVVGRFVRAMQIASDPNAYKNEYYAKIYDLFSEKKTSTATPAQRLRSEYDKIRALRTQELPAITIIGYLYTPRKQYTAEEVQAAVQGTLSAFPKHKVLALSDVRRPTTDEIKKLISSIDKNIRKNWYKLTTDANIEATAFAMTAVLSTETNLFALPQRLYNKATLPGTIISKRTLVGPNDPLHAVALSAIAKKFRSGMQRSVARPTSVKPLPLPESQDTVDTLDEAIPSPTAPLYYFAYGMLTNPNLMPKPARLIGAAKLQYYKLELLGHANVIEDRSSSVEGALWRVNPAIIDHLDTVEGIPHYYIRKPVEVHCNGKTYTAQIYVMTDDARQNSLDTGYPTQHYVDTMVAGYRVARIPVQQIATALDELEQRLDSGDDNENR